MPKLKDLVKKEYAKISILRNERKIEEIDRYMIRTNKLVDEVAQLLIVYCKKNNYPIDLIDEIAESIKDTAIIEGICAAEGDFTNIEDYVLVSKNQVFQIYKAMFDPTLSYDPDKALEYIISPNSCSEENQEEILRWSRMLVQYMANGLDNENEQLSKGSSKRKSNT